MTKTFEEKLKAYEKGELTAEEREAFEKELDRLENIYEQEENQQKKPSHNNEQKILRKGKWKARIQTTFYVFMIGIGIFFISTIGTSIYYAWGTPDRADVIRNVTDYTYALTDPYGNLSHSSTQGNFFFSLDVETPRQKQVGDEIIEVGQSESSFFFSYLRSQENTSYSEDNSAAPGFYLPEANETRQSDWNQLENLPEGTVSSAYISFDELLETDDVFTLLDDYNINILWFGVEAGAYRDSHEGSMDTYVSEPFLFGFPAAPIWMEEDMGTDDIEEEDGWFGTRTVSETSSSPAYEEGDSAILHEQFFKVLAFLSDHEEMADKMTFGDMPAEDMLNYLEENGIHHYGVVVTGPTKELLELRDNDAISALQLDETRLWNWIDSE
ncbi:anti-sigma factor [Oceanobacillus locisalsi]|uniref:Anti-sigma factor n=1 Tax=Oceanobacillus locisalsi TaxID=546107 RepID=A0ABW3NJ65_9BACI